MKLKIEDGKIGFLYIIIASVLFALAAPSAKYLFQQGITPIDLVQARISYSLIVMLPLLSVFQPSLLKIQRKDIPYFILLGIGGLALVQYTYFLAISLIDVGVALALQYTAPSIIVVYGVIVLGDRVQLKTVCAILLALFGCYLLVGAYKVGADALNWKGILIALASAISLAFYTLYGKKGLTKYSPWTTFFYAALFATLFWNIIHPPLVLVGQGLNLNIWLLVFYVSILGTLLPFSLLLFSLDKLDPVSVTVTSTLEPIFATISAFLLLGERPSLWQMIGGFFIIASIILMTFKKK